MPVNVTDTVDRKGNLNSCTPAVTQHTCDVEANIFKYIYLQLKMFNLYFVFDIFPEMLFFCLV